MNILKYTKYLLIIPVIIIPVLFWFWHDAPPAQTHLIVLTDKGFQPAEVKISRGDTITFTTDRNKEFWPASNLHPSHTIYSEFDPRKPVPPNQSWSFRFDKVGEWRFHDHLAPTFKGIIIVEDVHTRSAVRDCARVSDSRLCWQEGIEATLKSGGLDKAFMLLADLYEKEPTFAGQCHDFSHILGEFAYAEFKKNKDIELTPKTSYCGYGFYHGFMEALLQDTKSLEEARKFCAYAGAKLVKETSDAEGACYHGIGHGAVDGGDPRAWGDAKAMIEPALHLCHNVTGKLEIERTGDFLFRCVTGIYNALEVLSSDEKYKLTNLNENPFAFCLTQPPSYRAGCYVNLTPILMRSVKSEYEAAFAAMEKIPEPAGSYIIRSEVIMSLAHEMVRPYISGPDRTGEILMKCRSLKDPRSRLPCIEGLSGGHIKYGEPEKEYVRWLQFCGSDSLRGDEKEICYGHVLGRLRIWYSAEKSAQVCSMAPSAYQKFCN